jgi:hypothetical protein
MGRNRVVTVWVGALLGAWNAADAAVIQASSCAAVDVRAAVAAADDGDTVAVPAGECVWRCPSAMNPAVSISGKRIVLRGAGAGTTVITDSTGTAFREVALLVESQGGKPFRVTGFTFKGMRRGSSTAPGIHVSSGSRGWRIDHCTLDATGTRGRGIVAGGSGVIDHCTFVNTYQGVAVFGDGDQSWAAPLSPGTADAVYVESCVFDYDEPYDGALDAYGGARYVFRHNTVTNTNLGHHGFDSGNYRSTLSHEIYGNTFLADRARIWCVFRSRGGTGVLFDNVATGDIGAGYLLVNYRTCCMCDDPEHCHTTCSSWGRCDGTNPLDGNEDASGYPCKDQVGRGTDQSLEPVYEWNNTVNGEDADIAVNDPWGCSGPSMADHIKEGRDFYNDTPRPGYTPYPYPHPLTLDPSATRAAVGGAKAVSAPAAGVVYSIRGRRLLVGRTRAHSDGAAAVRIAVKRCGQIVLRLAR